MRKAKASPPRGRPPPYRQPAQGHANVPGHANAEPEPPDWREREARLLEQIRTQRATLERYEREAEELAEMLMRSGDALEQKLMQRPRPPQSEVAQLRKQAEELRVALSECKAPLEVRAKAECLVGTVLSLCNAPGPDTTPKE